MTQRNFKNIKEIYESSDQTEVNRFLEKGWKLLEIYQKAVGTFPVPQANSIYILGRPENICISSSEIKREIREEAKKIFETYCKEEEANF
ncbi:MAG TPA: hypothetical protein PL110_13000 [Candidatus Eremiobacteraeota bacterium]|nr:MAG: hypothetical protein BWY64_02323 [bacterium ADurb.Bin363]HPZ09029.1 hypothetical protein [Candidatus Eremiobacteraeota bacterium]